jgi:hypothetical protein
MVTATNGTATFKSLNGKNTYSVDFYIADVVGTRVKWDAGSGSSATSPDTWECPEDVVLTDLSITAGPTVMVALVPLVGNQQPQGRRYRIANFLSTLQTRPAIRLGLSRGRRFTFVEA